MTYITQKTFPTIRQIELVERKVLTAVAFDPELETFVVHVVFLSAITSLSSIASLSSTPSNADVHLINFR